MTDNIFSMAFTPIFVICYNVFSRLISLVVCGHATRFWSTTALNRPLVHSCSVFIQMKMRYCFCHFCSGCLCVQEVLVLQLIMNPFVLKCLDDGCAVRIL